MVHELYLDKTFFLKKIHLHGCSLEIWKLPSLSLATVSQQKLVILVTEDSNISAGKPTSF